MASITKCPLNTFPALFSSVLLLLFFIFIFLSSTFDSPGNNDGGSQAAAVAASCHLTTAAATTCGKLPSAVAETLVHYATSNVTPQQTLDEVSLTAGVLLRRSPCNFMVFGLGHDSPMWAALNHGGRTVFIEEDSAWIQSMAGRHPGLEAYHTEYDTSVSQAGELMAAAGSSPECRRVVEDVRASRCQLALRRLPAVAYETEWDLIMVDAPTGYHGRAPGRMGAIYTTGMVARGRPAGETDVFIHDVDRKVEDDFSMAFLCSGYLRETRGRLRHFTVPSHRARSTRPFCPST